MSLKLRLNNLALTCINKSQAKLSHWGNECLVRKFNAEFEAFSDDVFVVTYPKSGTTWTQMICYQLLTPGDIEQLPHIEMYAPHWEQDFVFGPAHPRMIQHRPRVFKTHMGYKYLPKVNARYLYVLRNGMDVAISFYHHHCNFLGYRGSFEDFWPQFLSGELPRFGSWFEHVQDFVKNKHNLNLLVVRYEDLKHDLEGQIRNIAKFLDVKLSEEAFQRATNNCSFEYMKKHQDKFDLATAKRMKQGMEKGRFIRQGKSGGWQQTLDAAKIADYRHKFEAELKGLGLDDYLPGKAERGHQGGDTAEQAS